MRSFRTFLLFHCFAISGCALFDGTRHPATEIDANIVTILGPNPLADRAQPSTIKRTLKDTFRQHSVFFITPKCPSRDYPFEVRTEGDDAQLLKGKPADVYCLDTDITRNSNNEAIAAIEALGDIPGVANAAVAFFSINDTRERWFGEVVCKLQFKRSFELKLIIDRGKSTNTTDHIEICLRRKSQLDGSGLVQQVQFGHRDGFGAFHLKLIQLSSEDEEYLVFGSGNTYKGIRTHFDVWHFAKVDAGSEFSIRHRCVIDAIADGAKRAQVYDSFFGCLSRHNLLPPMHVRDGLVLFLPFQSRLALKHFAELTSGANQIDVAISKFGYRPIRDLLLAALKNGTKVRLIVDDDAFWIVREQDNLRCEDCFITRREVEDWLAPLESAGASVKYMQTAHHCAGNFFHHKFVVFYGRDGANFVWTGAANFTHPAFHSNIESVYLFEDSNVVSAYEGAFSDMWIRLATSPSDMPAEFDPIPTEIATGCPSS